MPPTTLGRTGDAAAGHTGFGALPRIQPERAQMNHPSAGQQGAAGDLGTTQAQIIAQADGLEALGIGLGDRVDKAPRLVPRALPRFRPAPVDRVEGGALHQLRKQRRQGSVTVEEIQTQDTPVQREERTELRGDR
jgi:hypothetical protein